MLEHKYELKFQKTQYSNDFLGWHDALDEAKRLEDLIKEKINPIWTLYFYGNDYGFDAAEGSAEQPTRQGFSKWTENKDSDVFIWDVFEMVKTGIFQHSKGKTILRVVVNVIYQ
jgi:hypothetical protein